jgi:hypothetical protein
LLDDRVWRRYSSSIERERRRCGVTPVDVRDAAARPVVWWEALYGVVLRFGERLVPVLHCDLAIVPFFD